MSSNDKAFGVKDLKPNKSGLIPGKTGDGHNADPLTTAKHSRDEVDELIREGKLARGETIPDYEEAVNWDTLKEAGVSLEDLTEPVSLSNTVGVVKRSTTETPEWAVYTPVVSDDFLQRLLQTEHINGRLMDVEKQLDELKDRLVKAFKHAGFEF